MSAQRVNIAGGGLAGALLAVLLARRGIPVTVRERRPDPRTHPPDTGRSINLALAARGIQALKIAGLMERVQPLMLPMRGRLIHEQHSATAPHLLPYGQRDSEVIYSVGRADLNRMLIEAAAEYPDVTLMFDTICTEADPKGEVTIAADGAGSAMRHSLSRAGHTTVGESLLKHDYKELHIPPRDGEFALRPDALHIWPRHGFMLIALPNTDRSFTATLFLPRDGDPGFEALTNDSAVQNFFDTEFATAAALIPELPQQFRLNPQGHLGTIHADPWACGNVLLIGDAAHAIVPFHGQGMNAAFEDCAVLDGMLAGGEPDRHDWPTLFAAFSASRRLDTEAIAHMALENYSEMRSSVLDERFLRHKAWALQLERLYPDRFIPRYAMVMFHPDIPYSEALRRGEVQAQILDALEETGKSAPAGNELAPRQLKLARKLIPERL